MAGTAVTLHPFHIHQMINIHYKTQFFPILSKRIRCADRLEVIKDLLDQGFEIIGES